MGKIVSGVPHKGAKTCYIFFCHATAAVFQPLIQHHGTLRGFHVNVLSCGSHSWIQWTREVL